LEHYLNTHTLKKNLFNLAGAFALIFLLSSWGYTGHYKITVDTEKSLKNKIKGFNQWLPFIEDHSSDPDYRKFWVKSEAPRHYIDLDNYPEYLATGVIEINYDSLVKKHGEPFIIEQGILPWATIIAFDSLRGCFERNDWHRALLWASDLSHYVGDGHMPLHATKNYDGQESDNKGIHLRYESKMITAFAYSMKGKAQKANYIDDVPGFIFNYTIHSNHFCDSIFHSDNRAKQLTGNTDSPEYLAELWKNTSVMTASQMNKASGALSSLIYTAWKQAGSPKLDKNFIVEEKDFNGEITSLTQVPGDSILTVNYQIYQKGPFKLDVRTSDGGPLLKAGKWEREPGSYSANVNISTLTGGAYLVVLDCSTYASTKKFLLLH